MGTQAYLPARSQAPHGRPGRCTHTLAALFGVTQAVQRPAAAASLRRDPNRPVPRPHTLERLAPEPDRMQSADAPIQCFGTQIDLLSNMQKYADVMAVRNGGFPANDGQNVAVFYHPYPGTTTGRTSGGGLHSEQRIDAVLGPAGARANVDEIHSEFEPCPERCAPLITANYGHLAQANITYWWAYGDDESKVKGRKEKKVDLGWSKDANTFSKVSSTGTKSRPGGGGGGLSPMVFG